MNKINENIHIITEVLKNHKDSVYPIKNHPIEKVDDYLKDLYIKMLCVMKEFDENICEEQILFINRILKGSNIKQTINEYTKQALTIDESFVQEFILQFKEHKLKYNFFVDSLILALINKTISKNVIEFICKVSEMILLNKKEIEFLTEITLSIVEQNNERYHKINKKLDYIDMMWFWCYLGEYVCGCIESSENKLWYYSKEKRQIEIKNICKLYERLKLLQGLQSNKKIMKIDSIRGIIIDNINSNLICEEYWDILQELTNIQNKEQNIEINIEKLEELIYGNETDNIITKVIEIRSDNVIFENLIIDLTNTKLHFANSQTITFKNCEFIGGKNQIQIDACKNIIIDGCKFKNFTNRVFYVENTTEITIKKSFFSECSYNMSNSDSGIIARIKNIDTINIIESVFKNCKLTTNGRREMFVGSIILFYLSDKGKSNKGKLNIKKTSFINCKATNEEGYLFYSSKILCEDCEFIGCDPTESSKWYG